MEHKLSFIPNHFIPVVIMFVAMLISFVIIFIMWAHVLEQDKEIFDLNATIRVLESRKEADKEELRRMSLKELFERIDEDAERMNVQSR